MTVLACLMALVGAPDVFFISVDTLRADHLGCYGYAHATSPHIDELAGGALLFEDCVCEVPLTGPSFGAMLTSRFPRSTGMTRNGLRMPADVPTVAECFKQAGYQTFCVQSNWTLKADLSGLDRGFEHYDADFDEKRWGFIKPERSAPDVTGTALSLLRGRDPARPLFCWIHYSDPHAPYQFHKRFDPLGRAGIFADKKERVARKYDSEVAYADSHLGRLLEAIPLENTYVLFAADHGESLYEHDYLGHGRRIYQAGVHVPLIIRGPGIAPGRTDVPARTIDVGPTLLGMAGLAPLPGMVGMDLSHAQASAGHARFLEAYGGAVPGLPGAKALMAESPPQWQGVVLDGWKLIMDGPKRELYYLPDDPMEERDLSSESAERIPELVGLVEAWEEAYPRGETTGAALSDEDVSALRSLGYIE